MSAEHFTRPGTKQAAQKTQNTTFSTKDALFATAMSGDILLSISPATVTSAPSASGGWTRTVTITATNTAGDTHDWLNAAFANKLSVGDTSTAGTASIASTTLTFVDGVASVVVTGDDADWADTETDTLTVASITVLGYTVAGGTSVETFTA